MSCLDESRRFIALNIAVLTVSDTRTPQTDKSGALLAERIMAAGHVVAERRIIADERPKIEAALRTAVTDPSIHVVIATGGTGVTARDVTPEAFDAVLHKHIPGFGELFRMLSYNSVGTSTIQSRATAGVADATYLFALPGSTAACQDAWNQILVHQLDNRHRPCNLVELMPRLTEGLTGTAE